MVEKYSLKLAKGDLEIEISGPDKEFITNKLNEMIDIVKSSDIFKPTTSRPPPNYPEPGSPSVPEGFDAGELSGIEKIANDAGITKDELMNIFDFQNNEVYIHKEIKTGSDAEKQRIIAKLALVASEYVENKPELTGKALGRFMTELAIGSSSNLAANLKVDKGINKVKLNYRLNAVGRKVALETIKELSQV